MTEEWRRIPGWDGYEASSLGRIRSSNGVKTPFPDFKGYRRVKLWRHSKARNMRVNRLVAAAFHGPLPPGNVVRHRNGVNNDDRSANLQYGTRSENEQDKRIHGTALLGEKHHQSKLKECDIAAIRARYKRNSREHGSNAIAKDYGVTGSLVRYILRGEIWTHA